MKRSHPDTTATELQRLTDLVASQAQEIADLKRAAQEQALQALSDIAQADDALAKKDAEIDKASWQIGCKVAQDAPNTGAVVLDSRTVLAMQAEIARLQTGHDLYEVVRRMSVPQFLDAYLLNRKAGKPFDEIVECLAHEFGMTVRKVAP